MTPEQMHSTKKVFARSGERNLRRPEHRKNRNELLIERTIGRAYTRKRGRIHS